MTDGAAFALAKPKAEFDPILAELERRPRSQYRQYASKFVIEHHMGWANSSFICAAVHVVCLS